MKLLASLVFAGSLTHMAALYVGLHIGEARAEKPVVLTKMCPEPQKFIPRWDCGVTEAKTYCSTCLRRKWL